MTLSQLIVCMTHDACSRQGNMTVTWLSQLIVRVHMTIIWLSNCRLQQVKMVVVQEGEEPNDLCSLIGDRNSYHCLVKGKMKRQELALLHRLLLESKNIETILRGPRNIPSAVFHRGFFPGGVDVDQCMQSVHEKSTNHISNRPRCYVESSTTCQWTCLKFWRCLRTETSDSAIIH